MVSLLTREVIGTILVSLVFLVAAYIYIRVKQRRTSQESFLPAPEEAIGGELLFTCFYVATVFSSRPLERVWAHGLGIRGKAELRSDSLGISVHRHGERGFYIAFESIVAVERASATIDRGVEKGGLAQIRWMLGSQELITSLRITTNQERNLSQLMEIVREAK